MQSQCSCKLSMWRWNEMKWNEMKWNEMKWNEMKWNEMKWNEMKWNEMKWHDMTWDELSWDEMRWDEIWPSSQIPKFLQKIGLKKCSLLIKFFLKINDLRSSQRVPLQVACPPQIVYPCHPLLINPCSRCPNHMQSILNPMILLDVSYANLMFPL